MRSMSTRSQVTSSAPATASTGSGQRRHARASVRWPASCFANNIDKFDVVVVDVSAAGFGLTGPQLTLSPGDILFVAFDQIGTFQCRIAWIEDARFGVEIIDPPSKSNPKRDAALVQALKSIENPTRLV